MLTIGVLVSGTLGYETLIKIIDRYQVLFVFTDKNSTSIIEVCAHRNIPAFVGHPRKKSAIEFVKKFDVDVIASINYLFLLGEEIVKHPNHLCFNIHGSLLPKYRGRAPHIWAIINNESHTGITAHIIDLGCDTGPIIDQIEIPIAVNATGGDLVEIFKEFYFPLFERVIQKVINNRLTLTPQDERLATFFGKRTPEDGRIDWNWHRERISNWVRALAKPYPGAFSYFQDSKITINRVMNSELGFRYDDPNGLILERDCNSFVVKAPNGCLAVVEFEADQMEIIQIGHILI